MNKFTGVKREGNGNYCIYINGEMVTCASNKKAANAKLAIETARAQMNAQRAAANAQWSTANAETAYLIAERAGMRAA